MNWIYIFMKYNNALSYYTQETMKRGLEEHTLKTRLGPKWITLIGLIKWINKIVECPTTG